MRLTKSSLIVWGLLITFIVIASTLFLLYFNKPKLQAISQYSEYSLQIVDDEKLQSMLSELRIVGTDGDKNVEIKLVSTEEGKNIFLGENNQVISSSDYTSSENAIVLNIYINKETISKFEDNATGLFNHQLVSTLLTFDNIGIAFNRINLDGVEGSTVQDKRLNYVLQKYFEDFPSNKGNKYPIIITNK